MLGIPRSFRGPGSIGKAFFSEEKNQKTLAHTGFRGGEAAMMAGLVSPVDFALVPARSD
jgi:hypothetical protein